MVSSSPKELVEQFVDLTFVKNDLEEASKLLAADFCIHDPSRPGGVVVGIERWRAGQAMYLNAIPDRKWEILRQFQDGDYVITQWAIGGTQRGNLPGIPATNRRFRVTGILITRIEKRKIAEQWQIWDTQGFLEQLGVERRPLFKAA